MSQIPSNSFIFKKCQSIPPSLLQTYFHAVHCELTMQCYATVSLQSLTFLISKSQHVLLHLHSFFPYIITTGMILSNKEELANKVKRVL